MLPPSDWSDCGDALRSPDLSVLLQTRLVQLAFQDKNPAVAVKAIEILSVSAKPPADDALSDVPVDVLLSAESRLVSWLLEQVHE